MTGKLLLRLSDASRSGVYRAARADEILDAARGSSLAVRRVALAGAAGKAALLERLAGALQFPQWFGGNWDALEDCLTDLSWIDARGYVLVIEDAGALPTDERGVFIDVLEAAASFWAGRGRPFFAVFVGGPQALPPLYRERAP